jgi:hypothetical protein
MTPCCNLAGEYKCSCRTCGLHMDRGIVLLCNVDARLPYCHNTDDHNMNIKVHETLFLLVLIFSFIDVY